MSIRAFAETDPDPWKACHWNVTTHPHYHDCEHCDHARYGCEYGKAYLSSKYLKACLKEFEASIPPYPSRDQKRLP